MERIILGASETKISLNGASSMILQNKSGAPIQWSVSENSSEFFDLKGGETIAIDYEIWVKAEVENASVVVGRK